MALRWLDGLLKTRLLGPPLTFSGAHILKAIKLMAELGPIGRAALADRLGIGEGAVRTLLKRLAGAGLVRTARRGCTLTGKGEALWGEMSSKLVVGGPIARTSASFCEHGFAVLIRGVAGFVSKGIEQRDEAVRAGARGAVVLIVRSGKLSMPCVSDDVRIDYPDLFNEISSSLKPGEGDVVVIAFADEPLMAEYGALSAALSLLRAAQLIPHGPLPELEGP